LAVATVILSWAFTHTVFALHYAYEFYGEGQRANGLRFPGDNRPDYWDFIYFSFVIGTTLQVSDVAVTNRWIRHSVSAHGGPFVLLQHGDLCAHREHGSEYDLTSAALAGASPS
jgi:uncharacterized membrane protein